MMNSSPYRKNQIASETPRQVERHAMALITGRMHAAREQQDMQAMIAACYENEKLWTIFLADLADPGNAFPDELKAKLISLALWVKRHTSQVMQGRASADSLISVNRVIMEGLAGDGVMAAGMPAQMADQPVVMSV